MSYQKGDDVKSINSVKNLLSGGACLCSMISMAMSPAVFAKDDARASSVGIEEIIVTAQKRSEPLQKAPVAVSVLTEAVIQNAGINTVQDVARLTPNLVIRDQLRPGIQTISFRGFTTVQGGKSPFATIVDGVQQPGQEFLKQQLIDVEQIEVLRGPQGVLYGAGAIAGAINIVTKRPTNDFRVSGKVGAFEGNEYSGTLTASGPLVEDKVFFRVSGYTKSYDGQIRNEYLGNHVDGVDEHAFQGRLIADFGQGSELDLSARYFHDDAGALWLVSVTPEQFDDYSMNPSTDIDGVDTRDLQNFSARFTHDFGSVIFTSISAYDAAKQELIADGDFSPVVLMAQRWVTDTKNYSQEFRLNSHGQNRFNWMMSAFGQHYVIDDTLFFGPVATYRSSRPFTDNEYRSKVWALSAEGSYDITEQLTLRVGARYDRDSARAVDRLTNIVSKKPFSEFQPQASISYKFTDDLLGYAVYSKGFRTGGFNPTSPIAIRVYDNETSDNYELGFKSTWLDSRLTLNGALFYTDFKNQQYFYAQRIPEGIFRSVTNIPKTRTYGGELELQARIARDLTVQASVGYTDVSIREFPVPDLASDALVGNRTPQVYKSTAMLSVQYQTEIRNGLDFLVRLDADHRSDVYWDLINELRTPPKTFLNGRIAIGGGSTWNVALVGRNLTNERTPAAVSANPFVPQATYRRSANQPRQIGAEFQFSF